MKCKWTNGNHYRGGKWYWSRIGGLSCKGRREYCSGRLEFCAKTIDSIQGTKSECKSVGMFGGHWDPEFVKASVARASDTFGELHILVNNAGTCGRLGIDTMTLDMWDRDMDTNVKAAFLFIQASFIHI